MKRSYYYCCITVLLLLNTLCAPNPCVAKDHAYPYSKKGLWGLCTPSRKPITKALYDTVRSKGVFILGHLPEKKAYDVYTADGKLLLTEASSCHLITDTAILAITGALPTDTVPDNGKVHVIFASGRIVHYDCFLSLSFHKYKFHQDSIQVMTLNGKLGVYNLLRGRQLLPVRYNEVKTLVSSYADERYFLGWNHEQDYKVVSVSGDSISVAPTIYKTYRLEVERDIFYTHNGAFTLAGISIGENVGTTSNPGVFLASKEARGEIPYGYRRIGIDGGACTQTTWLVDKSGKPMTPLPGYTDSMCRDMGGGLFAFEKRKTAGQRKMVKQSNEAYICAIYDSRTQRIIATADFTGSRIYAGNNQYPHRLILPWSFETPDRILYMASASDTVAIVSKHRTGMHDRIPEFDRMGVLYCPEDTTFTYYENAKPLFHFDAALEPFRTVDVADQYRKIVHDRFYKGKVDGKWGLYKLTNERGSKYWNAGGAARPRSEMIVPPLYDDIIVPASSASLSVFGLVKGDSAIWVDSLGRKLIGGRSVDYLCPFVMGDGNRLGLDLDAPPEDRIHWPRVVKRMMIIDPQGSIKFECKSGRDFTPDSFFPVDDQRIFYNLQNTHILIDMSNCNRDALLTNYSGSVAVIQGRAVGLWGTRESIDIPMPSLDTKKDPSIVLVDYKDAGKIFADKSKKFMKFGPPFFEDGLTLYGEKYEFLGVVTSKGELYD
jgi:hypothetical protein